MTRLRSMLLTVGAVAGSLCLLVALAGMLFDVKPLVFRSGSMGPEIPAGALALSRPADAADLRVGDVVSVISTDHARVTHRVVGIDGTGEARVLTLQGDGNSSPDAEAYQVSEADRVFWSVPWVGHAVAWLGSPLGRFVLGGLTVGILAFVCWPRREDGGRRRGGRRAAMVAVPVAAGLVVSQSTGTSASFTDAAAATSGPVAAHTVESQTQPTCQNVDGLLSLGNVARITWAHSGNRYEYYWELRNAGSGAVVSSDTVGGGQEQGSTVTLVIDAGMVSTNTDYDVVVRARLTGTTTWVAATTTTTPVRRASVVIIGASFRCGHA